MNVKQNQGQLLASYRKKEKKRKEASHSVIVCRQRESSIQLTEDKRATAEIDRDRGVDSHRQRGKIC